MHTHGCYDIECDTTTASPLDCALRIRDFLARSDPSDPQDPPAAFDQLRAQTRAGTVTW